MPLPSGEECERIDKVYAKYKSTQFPQEADNARRIIEDWLTKHGLKWGDLEAVHRKAEKHRRKKALNKDEPELNLLDYIVELIGKYLWISPEERLICALWVLHTYLFDKYTFTPRLVLQSPVYGCGKTTLLILLEQLAINPKRYVNVTPALIYRLIGAGPPRTLLLDEGDNLNLLQDEVLRSVINANRRGDKIGRAMGKNETRDYGAYTPIAIAAVGRIPNNLMQRALIINMHRYPTHLPPLPLLDENDPQFREAIMHLRAAILNWANTCELDLYPPNPVKNRYADNWRPLLAIADCFGRGEEARAAALKMSAGLPDDDPTVSLLIDIGDAFVDLGVDRAFTEVLLGELHKGMWSDWTGPNDDQQAHKLTPRELARMLRPFKIYPKTIHQLGPRQSRGQSSKGYYRKDFEKAWESYCPRAPGPQAHRPTLYIADDSDDG
jgi:hypothetical protein